jgi:hypothetical protein
VIDGGRRRGGAQEEARGLPGPATAPALGAVERGEQRLERLAPVSSLSVLLPLPWLVVLAVWGSKEMT